MLLSRLAPLLRLLNVIWLPPGLGRPGPWGPPAWPGAATNETSQPQGSFWAQHSWEVFLALQPEPSPEPLPLAPREVLREHCRAIPFTQVLSRPGCVPARVRNRLCFGRCSSLYVPGPGPAPRALCSRCGPARQRRAPLVLRCGKGSRRRVKTHTVLVLGCRCHRSAFGDVE